MQVDGESFRLTDLGSGNGTLVNGEPARNRDLKFGDVIRVGATELRLEMEVVAEAATEITPAATDHTMPSGRSFLLQS